MPLNDIPKPSSMKGQGKKGFFQTLIDLIVNRQTAKLTKIYKSDPELQRSAQEMHRAIDKFEKDVDDYCKKYGC